ncbi:6-bladed beta-propeller [Parabacteroides sp. OttesenSCG-928-J18]|nr:6-bladed beta-propeller [Parabacteroides sp. OttesenSCG-928-J18]
MIKEIRVDFSNKKPLDISSIESDIQFIPLETNDSCLIHEIRKICLVDSLLVIGDNNSILFFESNGRFKNKIDKKGNGPEEYSRLSDFDIDRKTKVVTILDAGKKQLLHYNFQGEYLGRTPIGLWAIKLLDRDNMYYLYSGNQVSDENHYKINIIDKSSENSRGFYETDTHKSTYLHVHSAENFCFSDSNIYFYEAYNDTIYKLLSQKMDPLFYVNFSNRNIPQERFNAHYEHIADFTDIMRKNEYVYGIFSLVAYDSKFLFSFYDKKRYFALFDGRNTVVFDQVISKTISSKQIDLNKHYIELWNDENNIFFTSYNSLYIDNQEHIENEDLKEKIKHLKEDDNGIVGVLSR